MHIHMLVRVLPPTVASVGAGDNAKRRRPHGCKCSGAGCRAGDCRTARGPGWSCRIRPAETRLRRNSRRTGGVPPEAGPCGASNVTGGQESPQGAPSPPPADQHPAQIRGGDELEGPPPPGAQSQTRQQQPVPGQKGPPAHVLRGQYQVGQVPLPQVPAGELPLPPLIEGGRRNRGEDLNGSIPDRMLRHPAGQGPEVRLLKGRERRSRPRWHGGRPRRPRLPPGWSPCSSLPGGRPAPPRCPPGSIGSPPGTAGPSAPGGRR